MQSDGDFVQQFQGGPADNGDGAAVAVGAGEERAIGVEVEETGGAGLCVGAGGAGEGCGEQQQREQQAMLRQHMWARGGQFVRPEENSVSGCGQVLD